MEPTLAGDTSNGRKIIFVIITGFVFITGHVTFHCLETHQRPFFFYAIYPIQGYQVHLYRQFQLANEAMEVKMTFAAIKSAMECASLAATHNWYHFRHNTDDLRCEIGNADLDMVGNIVTYVRGKA